MIYRFGLMALATALLSAPLAANAAFISSTLGNPDSGLVDGQIVSSTDILGLQQNQSPPFDNIYGDDALDTQNGNFFQVWVHTYAAIAEPILSATLTLGIWDHDSAAAGSQVNLFALNNFLLTDTIAALFEAGGGEDFQYNVYEIAITGDALQSLAPGAAGFNLSLSGPTIDADGNQTLSNGAALLFSSLSIETRDAVLPVTEPGTLGLVCMALLLAGLVGGRPGRRRSAAPA